MRRLLLLCISIVALGCGEPQQVADETDIPTPGAQAAKEMPPLPDFDRLSKLAIIRGPDLQVRYGQNYEDALNAFAVPPGSWSRSELPPCLIPGSGASPYEARGWQTKDEGFGAIIYKTKVVVAVHEIDRADPSDVDNRIRTYQDEYGVAQTFAESNHAPMPGFIQGPSFRYWFWQSGSMADPGDQLLMVCVSQPKSGRVSITEAVGWAPIMKLLGMTPTNANADVKIMERQRSGSGSISSNSSNRAGV